MLQKPDIFENCLKVVLIIYLVGHYPEHYIIGHRVFILNMLCATINLSGVQKRKDEGVWQIKAIRSYCSDDAASGLLLCFSSLALHLRKELLKR